VRPGATRFATAFLTLESILQKKTQLRRFFLLDEYAALMQPKRRKKFADKARKMQDVAISNNFWKSMTLATKIFLPLVVLLRIVDEELKQPMRFIYGGLKDAMKEVNETFKNNESVFKPYVKAITQGMKGRLDTELHRAAYYVNPYYFYRDYDAIESDPHIMDAISNCVTWFYPDPKVQDIVLSVEIHKFKDGTDHFRKDQAKRQRENNDKFFNPSLSQYLSSLLYSLKFQ
jgi:hypothetical protein